MTKVPTISMDESHVWTARDVIVQLREQGAPYEDVFLIALAMLRELAAVSSKPGEMYANAIYALAQLTPAGQRDEAVKSVLDHLAERMEPSNV